MKYSINQFLLLLFLLGSFLSSKIINEKLSDDSNNKSKNSITFADKNTKTSVTNHGQSTQLKQDNDISKRLQNYDITGKNDDFKAENIIHKIVYNDNHNKPVKIKEIKEDSDDEYNDSSKEDYVFIPHKTTNEWQLLKILPSHPNYFKRRKLNELPHSQLEVAKQFLLPQMKIKQHIFPNSTIETLKRENKIDSDKIIQQNTSKTLKQVTESSFIQKNLNQKDDRNSKTISNVSLQADKKTQNSVNSNSKIASHRQTDNSQGSVFNLEDVTYVKDISDLGKLSLGDQTVYYESLQNSNFEIPRFFKPIFKDKTVNVSVANKVQNEPVIKPPFDDKLWGNIEAIKFNNSASK